MPGPAWSPVLIDLAYRELSQRTMPPIGAAKG
jgi:hypothetical protein